MGSKVNKNEEDPQLQELREENRLLKSILDVIPYSIYAKDLAGRYLVANQAKAKFHGLEKEEIIGKHWTIAIRPFC